MDDVLDQARRLAELLAAHPRTKELRQATAEISGDAAAKTLEEDYARLSAEVHQLEETGRPIEPETKRRVLDLQTRIRKSPPLQRLFRAHAQFAEMMDGVQRTLSGALDEALGGSEAPADGESAHGEGPAPGAPAAPASGQKPEEPGTGRILWTP
jgi:cell fate (sporulation/competence/biofilm development) regulator YlbF (YheA/YmcA/DUF963 family)